MSRPPDSDSRESGADQGPDFRLFHQLFQLANDAVYLHSLEEGFPGILMEVNEEGCRCLGYTREELLGAPVRRIIDPALIHHVRGRTDSVRHQGRGRFESAHVRKDGSRFPVEVTASLLEVEGRQAVLTIARDITGRRKTERRLEEKESVYRALYEGSRDGILIVVRDCIVDCNRAMAEMLGYKVDDLIGRPFTDFCYDRSSTQQLRDDAFRKALAGQSQRVGVSLRYRTGQAIECELVVVAVEIGSDSPALLLTSRNVTERRRFERHLADRNRYIEAILDNLPLGVLIRRSSDNVYEYLNRRFLEIHGWPAEEIRNAELLYEKIFPDPEYRAEMCRLILDRQPASYPGRKQSWEGIRIMRGDGSTRVVNVTGITLPDPGRAMLLIQDITERVEAEEQRHMLEEQLRHSQRMEAVGQLAGGIAHDFNNLLQAILGYLDFALEDSDIRESIRDDLLESKKAAKRAISLTNQILSFGRRQVLDPKDLNLNDLVAEMMKMLRRVLGEHIEVEFRQGHRLASVHLDPGLFSQVLVNLCVNSRDAMPDGGSILLETENVLFDVQYCASHAWASPGRYVLLSVTDSGAGMDEKTRERVFEPFFTTKAPGKGTGLGLSVVYGIVRQHEGMIQVYSEEGKGTRFKIYLPAVERRAVDVGPGVESTPGGGTETILLAEDDDVVRLYTRRLLEQAGYTVVAASDGEEAINLLRAQGDEFDLAFLDVVMPRLGGKDVFEEIQRTRQGLPVVFASGYSENAVHTGFVLHEGLTLLQKPFTRSDLLRAVRQAIDDPHQPGGLVT